MMQLRTLLVLVTAALTTVEAASIDHDKVQPFLQPEPITDLEKAAVKFKPSLLVKKGCHPYPAVNVAGETSAGLKGTGKSDGMCEGSILGSQVYSRSVWYSDKWAIMYAWYFPKDVQNLGLFGKSTRHAWTSVVVWLDNPALEVPKILATSVASAYGTGFKIQKPPKRSDVINGTTPKLIYTEERQQHTVVQSDEEGGFQDLIQWEQLTDAAREALQNTDFGEFVRVPFIDTYFQDNLKAASTYTYYGRRYRGWVTNSIW